MRFCFSCGPRIFYRCFRELTIFGNKRSKKFFLKYHQRRVFCILKLKIAKNSEESSLYLIFFVERQMALVSLETAPILLSIYFLKH